VARPADLGELLDGQRLVRVETGFCNSNLERIQDLRTSDEAYLNSLDDHWREWLPDNVVNEKVDVATQIESASPLA
jgi:hypothetical protein